MTYLITREHEIHCGHRVVGHEGKCQNLHGHGYVIKFTCKAEKLDSVGRVIDFSVIKEKLCMWIENHWDHKFLAWEQDQVMRAISDCAKADDWGQCDTLTDSIVWVPFNPTAENMAEFLVEDVAPIVLGGTGVVLVKCVVEETRKCSATYTKE